MKVFSHPEFDGHEQVVFCHDKASGLRAIIAVHDTTLGPALGGIRMWSYADEEAALYDVLRLSRGMTSKSALAGLSLGGGKSVVIGDPHRDKTPALMQALARCVNDLGGRYIAAEDSGTTVADLRLMHQVTRYVTGVQDKPDGDGRTRSGDPSPSTARGVFAGIKAAVRHVQGQEDLTGVRVALQGVGSVGFKLARLLYDAGAELILTDVDADRAALVAQELNAEVAAPDEIFSVDVDVFAPCAMGAVLNDVTIDTLRARIVAGAANNQLAEARHARSLAERGILYAPDFVINAGGVIDVAQELNGFDAASLAQSIERIGVVLNDIFERADRDELDTLTVAEKMANERLAESDRHPQAAATG